MYKDMQISATVACQGDKDVDLVLSWILRRSPCANEFIGVKDASHSEMARLYMDKDYPPLYSLPYSEIQYLQVKGKTVTCHKNKRIVLEAKSSKLKGRENVEDAITADEEEEREWEAMGLEMEEEYRNITETSKDEKGPAHARSAVSLVEMGSDVNKSSYKPLVNVWSDGYYMFVISFDTVPMEDINITVTVHMKLEGSYISAADRPLLVFYEVMMFIYVFYAIIWMVLIAHNWSDVLPVQFLIGAVITLGTLENVEFFRVYEDVNKTGKFDHGALVFAELVSSAKSNLNLMVLFTISLGPKSKNAFLRVLFVGGILLILGSAEACLGASVNQSEEQKEKHFIVLVPLAMTETIVWIGIWKALRETNRNLRQREGNHLKRRIYVYFMCALFFTVVASLSFMVWFLVQHKLKRCMTDRKGLWLDEAFHGVQFSVTLLIVMVLWRPSPNKQRYAFSPLLLLDDAESDVNDELAFTKTHDGLTASAITTGGETADHHFGKY